MTAGNIIPLRNDAVRKTEVNGVFLVSSEFIFRCVGARQCVVILYGNVTAVVPRLKVDSSTLSIRGLRRIRIDRIQQKVPGNINCLAAKDFNV
jgi:hypothetical protein